MKDKFQSKSFLHQFLLIFIIILLMISCSSKKGQNKNKYMLVPDASPIYISNQTEKIGATWLNGKVWDQPLIERFYDLLKERDGHFVVLDIGAQTGCFTLLAKYFPDSRWYAFEPIKEAADELKANLALNDIEAVSVHQVALSDQKGVGYLRLPKDAHWGLATLGESPVRFNEYEERAVELVNLDDFAKDNHINQVDFIKIDTEGWELHVLNGGKELIRKNKPIMLIECNSDNMKQCHVIKENLLKFLNEMDYKWEFASKEDLLCVPKSIAYAHESE